MDEGERRDAAEGQHVSGERDVLRDDVHKEGGVDKKPDDKNGDTDEEVDERDAEHEADPLLLVHEAAEHGARHRKRSRLSDLETAVAHLAKNVAKQPHVVLVRLDREPRECPNGPGADGKQSIRKKGVAENGHPAIALLDDRVQHQRDDGSNDASPTDRIQRGGISRNLHDREADLLVVEDIVLPGKHSIANRFSQTKEEQEYKPLEEVHPDGSLVRVKDAKTAERRSDTGDECENGTPQTDYDEGVDYNINDDGRKLVLDVYKHLAVVISNHLSDAMHDNHHENGDALHQIQTDNTRFPHITTSYSSKTNNDGSWFETLRTGSSKRNTDE